MRRSMPFCVAFIMSLIAPRVAAFDQAGHFYTAYALTWTAATGRSSADRLLAAFCAQLPDMAADIDATRVYKRAFVWSPIDWARWGVADDAASPKVRKMITVQHLLHALTGGNAAAVQEVARRNTASLRAAYRADAGLPERAVQLCAWGFSLHFLGDSLAHERLEDTQRQRAAADRQMYGTGLGHAFDGHDPDYVLCAEYVPLFSRAVSCHFTRDPERRFAAWEALWSKEASATFDPDSKMPGEMGLAREKLFNQVIELGTSVASARNRWGEDEMRKRLLSPNESISQIQDFIKRFDGSSRSCESVLAEGLATLPALNPFSGLTCAGVWQRYERAIRDAFAKAPTARRALKQDFDAVYVMPLDKE